MTVYRWEELLEHCGETALAADVRAVFPCNPADTDEARHVMEDLALAVVLCEGECDEDYRIRIREQGIHPVFNLPLVTVEGPGGMRMMKNYPMEQLVQMKIDVDLKETWSPGRILALLILNLRYPLRVERQKKRDAVAEWLHVISKRKAG